MSNITHILLRVSLNIPAGMTKLKLWLPEKYLKANMEYTFYRVDGTQGATKRIESPTNPITIDVSNAGHTKYSGDMYLVFNTIKDHRFYFNVVNTNEPTYGKKDGRSFYPSSVIFESGVPLVQLSEIEVDVTKPEVNNAETVIDADKIGKTLLGQDYVSVNWYKNGFVDENQKRLHPEYANFISTLEAIRYDWMTNGEPNGLAMQIVSTPMTYGNYIGDQEGFNPGVLDCILHEALNRRGKVETLPFAKYDELVKIVKQLAQAANIENTLTSYVNDNTPID